MDAICLLGSIPSKSHVIWLALFVMGYGLREFVGFCRRHPRIRKRDPAAVKAMVRAMMPPKPVCGFRYCGVGYLSSSPAVLMRRLHELQVGEQAAEGEVFYARVE